MGGHEQRKEPTGHVQWYGQLAGQWLFVVMLSIESNGLEYQPDLLLCSVVLSCLAGGKGVAWAESNGGKRLCACSV